MASPSTKLSRACASYAFTHNLALLEVAHAVVHHQDTLDGPPS
ncbi:hypothetical protein [Streptomyces formicae]